MKNTIIKSIVWAIVFMLTIGIIGFAYSAWVWLKVSEWDNLTHTQWNKLVTRLEKVEAQFGFRYKDDWETIDMTEITWLSNVFDNLYSYSESAHLDWWTLENYMKNIDPNWWSRDILLHSNKNDYTPFMMDAWPNNYFLIWDFEVMWDDLSSRTDIIQFKFKIESSDDNISWTKIWELTNTITWATNKLTISMNKVARYVRIVPTQMWPASWNHWALFVAQWDESVTPWDLKLYKQPE
jgi:hypothetical protein